MEEKADRQDDIASTVEDAQARLEEAEAKIAAITGEMESSAEETQVQYVDSHRQPLHHFCIDVECIFQSN